MIAIIFAGILYYGCVYNCKSKYAFVIAPYCFRLFSVVVVYYCMSKYSFVIDILFLVVSVVIVFVSPLSFHVHN